MQKNYIENFPPNFLGCKKQFFSCILQLLVFCRKFCNFAVSFKNILKFMETVSNIIHHGQNVRRLRDILNIKQESIAAELKISQQSFSNLEQKKIIDNDTLEKISQVLGIPVEVIKNFDEVSAVNIIANTFNDSASSFVYKPTFNPTDKIVELYERLLKVEQEKNALLEKQLELQKNNR